MRVLIVEDEAELAARLALNLERHGMTCERLDNAEDAESFAFDGFTVAIIDLGLPGMGGVELIRSLRRRGLHTPILILTARSAWQDKVEGLNAGADDFIVKPVRVEELVARLHALARRTAGQADGQLRSGDLVVDPALAQATLDGRRLDLTATELKLLSLLMLNQARTLSQAVLLDHLYPLDTERETNTIEVHIGRLRRKVGRDRVVTVRGVGYRLAS